MKKILIAFATLFVALTSCVKNNIEDINTDGNVYTEDFFIINGSEHAIKMYYIPYNGNSSDEIALPSGDTIAIRSMGKGDVAAAPFVGKLYIAYDNEEWVPFYAYTDKSKDVTNPKAYERRLVSADFYQSTYIFQESDYSYWLKVKSEATENSEN